MSKNYLQPQKIAVTSVYELTEAMRVFSPTHVILALDPDFSPPANLQPDSASCLLLRFNDVDRERQGAVLPSSKHIKKLKYFVSKTEADSRILICCHAGRSRSIAILFVLLCHYYRDLSPMKVARCIVDKAPYSSPNHLIINIATEEFLLNKRVGEALRYFHTPLVGSNCVTFKVFDLGTQDFC